MSVQGYRPSVVISPGAAAAPPPPPACPEAGAATLVFSQADLVGGVFSAAHNLGFAFVIAAVYDNTGVVVQPDELSAVDADTLAVDLTSFEPIAGMWYATIVGVCSPAQAAPLDALPVEDRARMRYGHWSGGRLFSEYNGPWGVVQRSDDDTTSEFSSLAEALAFTVGTEGLLAETRDQIAGNHLACAVKAAMGSLCDAAGVPVLDPAGNLAYRLPAYNADYEGYRVAGLLGLPADDSAMSVWHNAWDFANDYGMLAWWFADVALIDTPLAVYGGEGAGGGGRAAMLNYLDPAYLAYVQWDTPVPARWNRVLAPNAMDTSNVAYAVNGVTLAPPSVFQAGPFSRGAPATQFVYASDRPGALTASALLVFEGALSAPGQAIVDAFIDAIS